MNAGHEEEFWNEIARDNGEMSELGSGVKWKECDKSEGEWIMSEFGSLEEFRRWLRDESE